MLRIPYLPLFPCPPFRFWPKILGLQYRQNRAEFRRGRDDSLRCFAERQTISCYRKLCRKYPHVGLWHPFFHTFNVQLYLQWLETQNYVEVTRKWYGRALYFPLSIFIPTWKHNTWQRRLMEDTPQDYVQQKGIEVGHTHSPMTGAIEIILLHLATEKGRRWHYVSFQPSGRKGLFLWKQVKILEMFVFFDICIVKSAIQFKELCSSHSSCSPSSLDTLVFGCLEVIIQQWSSENNSLARQLHSCTNLKQFCNRIHQNCFPALKPSTPPPPLPSPPPTVVMTVLFYCCLVL